MKNDEFKKNMKDLIQNQINLQSNYEFISRGNVENNRCQRR